MPFFIAVLPPPQILNQIQSFRKKWDYTDSSPPHIKVKASSGLTATDDWIPKIEQICRDFPAFEIKLGAPATFGSTVLFNTVLCKEIITLHLLFVDAINPSLQEQKKHYEVTDFIPHLTIAQKTNHMTNDQFKKMKQDADHRLDEFAPFFVPSVHIFSMKSSTTYTPVLELPLRPLNKRLF
ncbi:2'-5' RNA ligase family protein [Pseudalkalibacillus hwajinpoensis]|uniref:2'-5' RNA ligase family protein n=1 Tax=Guptibacillus hwajinpoensis TaxID=208199 RepID=UPI001CFC69D2|nr:2'-5' RNA ligase family protein [Pseudalkalibacillus hwajinpoensis]